MTLEKYYFVRYSNEKNKFPKLAGPTRREWGKFHPHHNQCKGFIPYKSY